jgi:rhodanese-related sulfurtransferase
MDSLRISPEEAKRKLDRNEAVFIDTRNPVAWGESEVRIPNAIRLLHDELSEHLNELPKNREIIAYCT